MKKIMIDSQFWAVFPEAQINILVLKDIINQASDEERQYFSQLLNNAAQEASKLLTEETFSQNQVVVEWRDAYSRFKTKKGARSSIEALLKRVDQKREFTPINPLVDIYNSISLKYGVPCGGEDIDSIAGNLHLGKAKGGEQFLPLGADKDEPALVDEIIYYDDEGAVCRCFNWREAQRTMLTNTTTNAVLLIEAINKRQVEQANRAIEEMQQLMNSYFKTESDIKTLNSNNSVVTL